MTTRVAVDEALSSTLVQRLRERVICVPKPGTESFEPIQPFWVTVDYGPHKDGDEAGLQYLPSYSAINGVPPAMRVQPHIYVTEPLMKEAAEEIERLTTQVSELYGAWNGENERRRDAEELVERLLAALRRYGEHQGSPIICRPPAFCLCGLEKLLRETAPPAERKAGQR